MDISQYEQILIESLNLSVRSYNTLKRAGINTLQELLIAREQGSLLEIKNLGMKSFKEINNRINEVTVGDNLSEDEIAEEDFKEEENNEYIVPEEIENIPISELNLSTRIFKGLSKGGFDTVGKVLRMTPLEMAHIHHIGKKSIEERRIMGLSLLGY